MMYEDAKISKRNIYITYSDFKGAFGGMDHRILSQLMKNMDSKTPTLQRANNYIMPPTHTT
jgi:hypothetical protein